MNEYIRCTRCVMDNSSDTTIKFDEEGYCDYCNHAVKSMGSIYFPNETGAEKIMNMLDKIKANGRLKKYDCIMGLSGGLDSSYLLYLGYKWNLRILAVHIDDGYDTEISKQNLKYLIQTTGFDYETLHPNNNQFNGLTKAFMTAGVPNLAMPQDNAIIAYIYILMKKYKIKYFLSGSNFSLESILQRSNTHNAFDLTNIMDINRKFGTTKVDELTFVSSFKKAYYKYIGEIITFCPLNYVKYERNTALRELNEFCGFQYYGSKHLENSFTEFVQLYWFPKKFGVDKRKSHLSSMIISGQITREEALKELEKPLCDKDKMESCISLIKEKLKLTDEEFMQIMQSTPHQHDEYKTENERLIMKTLWFLHSIRRMIKLNHGKKHN